MLLQTTGQQHTTKPSIWMVKGGGVECTLSAVQSTALNAYSVTSTRPHKPQKSIAPQQPLHCTLPYSRVCNTLPPLGTPSPAAGSA